MKSLTVAVIALGLWAVNSALAVEVKVTPIHTDQSFERPVVLIAPPGDTERQFLVEQTGKIKILSASGGTPKVFLDFSDRNMAAKDFEEGLLGLAFHPKYAENGKFYVYYSQQGPKRSVISELQVSKGNPDQADTSTERILFEIQQPEWNHNSGNIFFGPKDGFLYICVGDGGARNGVHLLAQKLTCWNGKVLRIDVDSRTGSREYAIPSDNPFVSTPFASPEIYAYGLRNPWGAGIDPKTGLFWLADVGQNLYEEVNLITKGGNYGWEYREGFHKFNDRDRLMDALSMGKKKDPPKNEVLLDPIWEYGRLEGFSITGGFVYYGSKIPALNGYYIVGDWKSGNTWGIKYDSSQGKVVDEVKLVRPKPEEKFQPTGFYPDLSGEIVVLNWDGRLFRIDPN